MSRQSFEALPCLHIPYPHTFIKLQAREKIKVIPQDPNLPLTWKLTCPPHTDHWYLTLHIIATPPPRRKTCALTDPETMRLDCGLKLQQKT
jgi:hypothetical protein